jgi:hypothetical protein
MPNTITGVFNIRVNAKSVEGVGEITILQRNASKISARSWKTKR